MPGAFSKAAIKVVVSLITFSYVHPGLSEPNVSLTGPRVDTGAIQAQREHSQREWNP